MGEGGDRVRREEKTYQGRDREHREERAIGEEAAGKERGGTTHRRYLAGVKARAQRREREKTGQGKERELRERREKSMEALSNRSNSSSLCQVIDYELRRRYLAGVKVRRVQQRRE